MIVVYATDVACTNSRHFEVDVNLTWGVWFEPTQPVKRICELAQLAESLGAKVCLIADEGTERDLYVTLTAVLLTTDSMTVGPGITNPFSRHPVTTAAAIATLDEMAPGRIWHGLGVGGSRVLEPLGMHPDRPYTALKKAFIENRDLLTGSSVGLARLPWHRGRVPTAMAGRGPRVQQLASEEADWVILSAKALNELPATARKVRAAGNAQIGWSAYLAYNARERHRVLRHFSYMAVAAPADLREEIGLDDRAASRVKEAMLKGDLEEAVRHLPESLVDRYAVTGTPAECALLIAEHQPHFDLFLLPMNDETECEAHIRSSAAILNQASCARD